MTRGKTGEFRLAGLVAAWRLDLELPAPFRVATGTLPMADSRPRLSAASVGGREVVLELVEANSIAGRVVSEEGVAAAGVQLLLRAPAGEGEIELARASSAEDGRFMLCDWPTRAERLELLCDWSGMSWAMAIDASEELRRDLGEIRVPASRRVPIQVQDRTTGANLVGASLCRSGSPAVLRTGSRGGVLLPVLESEREVELDVAAPGYQFQRLRFVIPRDGGPGVVVALEPASVLELDCLDDAGRSLPGARVLLRAERALLREPLAAGSAAFASANSQRIRLWERKGRGFGNLLADRQGRLRIEDLQPDLAIDLTLATFGKQESGRLAGVTLHPGETRRIELRSERPLHDLKAAVMAEDGRPLAGAAVRIGRPEGDGYLEFSSDAEGRVCVRGLPLAEVSVTVLMDGFRAERRRVNLGERDQDLAFVLATAPQVDLLFRSGGRVVDPDLCYLRDPTLPRGVVRAERIETGSFRLELPGPGVVDVEVAMGLATHRLRVDPADGPVQTVDLPVHAALVVDGSSLAADARSPVIVFELPNGSCRRLELDARRRLETSLPLGSYRYWVTVEQDGKTATIRPPSPLDLVSAESVEILLR
ncbi:MAG: carboxypeptidase regulatory-like domain-containing protein [Planctomycetes bacterium]|nr:carboxypeptidase regulatory-like domain-containing protein [Planctomycetota bacterium]